MLRRLIILSIGILLCAPHATSAQSMGREASFLPVPEAPPAISIPVGTAAIKPTVEVAPPISATGPASSFQIDSTTLAPPDGATALPTPMTPAQASVVTGAPSAVIVMPTPATPAAPSPLTATPTPSVLGAPVETAKLADINPEAVGLLSDKEGGLGAKLWTGTSRTFVTQLLPSLNLPTPSPVLNDLARRFLLTSADAPQGTSDGKTNLAAQRLAQLLALGDVQDAWKLAAITKPDLIDTNLQEKLYAYALVSPLASEACGKLPEIIKAHTTPEFQKELVVCQLQAKDNVAAQLSLDLLHGQNVSDDIFFSLAEKNVIAGTKQLPRQLTPLRPLTLALLRLTDLPVRSEVYVRPEAALISELLKAHAEDEMARLGLAERSASRGLLSGVELAALYAGQNFTPMAIGNAATSSESGSRLRALLYQAAIQSQTAPGQQATARVMLAARYMKSFAPNDFDPALAEVAAMMLGTLPTEANYGIDLANIVRIYIVANRQQQAYDWLKLAWQSSPGNPALSSAMQPLWPLALFSGLEPDNGFSHDLNDWLEATLKNADVAVTIKSDGKPDAKALEAARHVRATASAILLLCDADGYAIPAETWGRVADAPEFERHAQPPAFIMDRLRDAGTANRRGDSVLLSLLAVGGDDPALNTMLQAIRALRLSGLSTEASSLAREMSVALLAANNS